MALHLGIWNVEQDEDGLIYQISTDQLARWVVYHSINPFGEERADWRCAQTTAAIYNVNIVDKHHKTKVSDFMLSRDTAEQTKAKSSEQLRAEWYEHKEHMKSMGRVRRKQAERRKVKA